MQKNPQNNSLNHPQDYKQQVNHLAHLVEQAKTVCVFTGAGASTESGIPDYRSRFGIWTKMEEEGKDPQYFAHYKRLVEDPAEFFGRRIGNGPGPKPNPGHYALAQMEGAGKDIRIVTQNVDGLHQEAGHRSVVELHGSHHRWYCMGCDRPYKFQELRYDHQHVPRCYICNGVVRPDVVYFGENIDPKIVAQAERAVAAADLLLIVGTTLATGRAKRLARSYTGGPVVVINCDEISIRPIKVDLFIQAGFAQVMQDLKTRLDHI